jgi:hypothetical protein
MHFKLDFGLLVALMLISLIAVVIIFAAFHLASSARRKDEAPEQPGDNQRIKGTTPSSASISDHTSIS